MEKRLISFAPKMYRRLQRRARQLEISVAELVRRIIDEWWAEGR
jgi:hypothetical protein